MEILKNFSLGQYIPGDSIIHRLDARTKIFILILFLIEIFYITDFINFFICLVLILIIAKISKIPFGYLLKGLKPILFLIIITLIFNLFFTNGTVIYTIGFLKITKEGLNFGFQIAGRLIILVMLTSLISLTTSPIQLTDAIESLLSPFKKYGFPAHEIAMMMTIALRFIPVLIMEAEKIIKAQISRGADFESRNIFTKVKCFVPVLIPLFVHAFRSAEELAVAMEARCYIGGEGRTSLRQQKIARYDLIAVICSGIILIFIVIIENYAVLKMYIKI